MAAKAVAKASSDQDKDDHEATMAAHMGQHAMATTLAVGATNEEAIVAGVAAQTSTLRAGDTVHMQD